MCFSRLWLTSKALGIVMLSSLVFFLLAIWFFIWKQWSFGWSAIHFRNCFSFGPGLHTFVSRWWCCHICISKSNEIRLHDSVLYFFRIFSFFFLDFTMVKYFYLLVGFLLRWWLLLYLRFLVWLVVDHRW